VEELKNLTENFYVGSNWLVQSRRIKNNLTETCTATRLLFP